MTITEVEVDVDLTQEIPCNTPGCRRAPVWQWFMVCPDRMFFCGPCHVRITTGLDETPFTCSCLVCGWITGHWRTHVLRMEPL